MNTNETQSPGSMQRMVRLRRPESRKVSGVCVLCGSALLVQYWRGCPENERVHCNSCGTDVTPWMHAHKQPNDPSSATGRENPNA